MAKKLVSIVMPVFNDEKYLSSAIRSILSQSYEFIELIVVNDGSTDNSLKIANHYANCDKRVKILDRPSLGISSALNAGFSAACGAYIARMDSDDIALPNRIEKQLFLLDRNPDIGICGSLAYLLNKDCKITGIVGHEKNDSCLKPKLLFSVCFLHPTIMVRPEVLDYLTSLYSESYYNSQDYELWCRLSNKTRFYNIQRPLLIYRENQFGISASVNRDGIKRRFPLVQPVQSAELAQLPLRLTAGEKELHFKLSINSEMSNIREAKRKVYWHLVRILNQNKRSRIFDRKELRNFLAKKYFVYLTMSRKTKLHYAWSLFANYFALLGLAITVRRKLFLFLVHIFYSRELRPFKTVTRGLR